MIDKISTDPTVDVGILESYEISVGFLQTYISAATRQRFNGLHKFSTDSIDGNVLELHPEDTSGVFEIKDVVIGKGFHWQQKENQRFHGNLMFKRGNAGIIAVNRLPVERYLESVISSEMSANASLELLKAHAVISRSWLMAQISGYGHNADSDYGMTETATERIRWYDHSQHQEFDVCADDHCQRYQGITRILNPNAVEAVKSTEGEILMFDGKICDARFSKCCGGAFETFENCWQPVSHPYLKEGRDILPENGHLLPDLTVEQNAEKWINGNPASFCNTKDAEVLRQVLNGYDLATPDFYRWTVRYSQKEISEIVRDRSGYDFGNILDIVPVERGVSGRLIRAKIIGTKRTMTIGKELEIRKTLSKSHLYSSAFTVEKEFSDGITTKNNDAFPSTDIPSGFTLKGAGWGHGVGLCQIGAALMAQRGYSYRQILTHYYTGARLKKQ
jgi:amidase enhancer